MPQPVHSVSALGAMGPFSSCGQVLKMRERVRERGMVVWGDNGGPHGASMVLPNVGVIAAVALACLKKR